jgi:microcystin-dependent protein
MSYNKVNQTTGDLEQIAGSQVNSVYSDAPLGVIMPYGGTTVPTAWLECDGSAVSRTTYADLFAVLGTKFGPGDGSTTFNLPSGDFGAQLYPAFEGMYIIKAIKTVLPTDFQEALEVKQNITDNTLQTTSKTVPEAINEINSNLSEISNEFSIENIQNIKFKWGADLQRFEIIATLYPADALVLIQFNYDNTIKMFQSSDGGSTWQNIWVK